VSSDGGKKEKERKSEGGERREECSEGVRLRGCCHALVGQLKDG